jgi:dipeptidyl aminopeptidase/acylaminoacyl peptidase
MKAAPGSTRGMTPPRQAPLDVDTLWRLARVGALALSPDGRHAVCAIGQPDMEANRSRTHLWRLSTPGTGVAPEAREFTHCGDQDSAPAYSPDGTQIAFVARRPDPAKAGQLDATPQLYLMPADGGEARRVSDFAPGVGAFRWLPDGRSLVFVAWVWPELNSAKAQAARYREHGERRETGQATIEMQYRHFGSVLPSGREPHLMHLVLASGRITDLMQGSGLALPRADPGLSHFAVHPDGRRVAVVHDPAAVKQAGACCAISEIDLRSRRVSALLQQADWSFHAPSYRPDGQMLACIAAHRGQVHTAPQRLATLALQPRARWQQAHTADWDHEVDAPLCWQADGQALWFTAEDRGRRPLWRHRLNQKHAECVVPGGWVHGFALAGDELTGQTLVTVEDCALHPPQVQARTLSATGAGVVASAPRRLERFNDAVLDGVALGAVQEKSVVGALGDTVQAWLIFPTSFKPRQKHAVLHVIHGGPHAAAGDTWSWRWNPHVLASRGAVVVQVNYHGSSGFGQAFKHSLIGRQGELELQDIEACTDWLHLQPWVDPKRVFATGGSYGGFLVAWMNGHVPYGRAPRYRAYVCHAGVFDRVATMSADSYLQRPKDLGARYWEDLPQVLAQSPMNFAADMHTPTLVIHGAQDFRVPDCNGLAYYNTLKARGVPARLLWFPDEHHWVLKPRNSRQWYGEFLDWIAAHDTR